MIRLHNHPRGFTLIEVLIGMIFLAIGLLAIAGLQITSVRGNFFSNNLMHATYVAQDRLEFLKTKDFDSDELKNGVGKDDGHVTYSGISFNGTYTVVDNKPVPADTDLKTITYAVTWNDGAVHRITFSTIRSR